MLIDTSHSRRCSPHSHKQVLGLNAHIAVSCATFGQPCEGSQLGNRPHPRLCPRGLTGLASDVPRPVLVKNYRNVEPRR